MKKAETTASVGYIIGIPILIGTIMTLMLFLMGALLVQSERLPTASIPAWTMAVLGISGFMEALIAACRAPRSKFIWGLATSAIFLLCLLAISVLWVGQPIDFLRVLTISGITLFAAFFGSMIGASRLKRKRKK